MSTFEKSPYKVVLLTVLVLSVFTIAIVEIVRYRQDIKGRKGEFYDKEGTVYHGQIYEEQRRTRCERMRQMKKTTMQFYETKHSFGSVTIGRVLTHTFRYKNTGSFPLLICKADVSCGCTVPRFPDDPIAPGMDGEFTVEFNTAGKSGFQQKNIIVHSNSLPEAVSISVEADVHE
jgi:hypothetical protein